MDEIVSQNAKLDERRDLIMALQALLDLDMLRIISVLLDDSCELGELAELCAQEPSLARGPLARLSALGIIDARTTDGQIICSLNQTRFRELRGMLQRLSKDLLSERPATPADSADMAAQERKILQSCFKGDQLIAIPSSPRRLELVLHWLVEQFERQRRYPERELNEIIKRYHPDFATLRRNLIDHGLMERANNIYWRT